MKTLVSFVLFILMNSSAIAQLIKQPQYTFGHYENDTVLYAGAPASMDFPGPGGFMFGNGVPSSPVSGVKFYILIEQINSGGAPIQSIFWDSLGTPVAMHVGDKKELPVKYTIHAGSMKYYITIEGTPTVKGQDYLCNLFFLWPTGLNSRDVITTIGKSNNDICKVDLPQGIVDQVSKNNVLIYPNPAADQLTINMNAHFLNSPYFIFDKLGREVQNGLLTSQSTVVNIQELIPGDYVVRIGLELQATFKFIKQ